MNKLPIRFKIKIRLDSKKQDKSANKSIDTIKVGVYGNLSTDINL